MNLRWRSALFSGLSVLVFAAVVFVQIPAEIFAGNSDEFSWPLKDLLGVYAPWAALAIASASLITALLPERGAQRLAALLSMLAVVAWLNGSFFVYNFGLLDGQNWNIEAPLWRITLELAVCLLAAMLIGVTMKSRPRTVALLLAALSFSAAIPALLVSSAKKPPENPDLSSFSSFSPDKNVLVVLLDGMQSDIFEDVLAGEKKIASAFDGFTHYIDTTGVAMTTYLTVPAIHSGTEYQAGMSIKKWYADGVSDGSFVNNLTSAGYRSSMVNPVMNICPSKAEGCASVGTAFHGIDISRRAEASTLANIGLLRAVPFPLKSTVYNKGRWLLNFAKYDPRTAHHSIEGNSFMNHVASTMAADSTKPTVKFFHLFSTHLPVVLDKDCKFASESKNTRAGFLNQARCALSSFAGLLNALKEKGIYDKTAIVLLSDHGSGGWANPRSMEDRSLRASTRSVANPTLAIKPFGARGASATSDRPASIADVASTVCDMTRDCNMHPQRSLLAMPDTGRLARRFNSYKWRADYWSKDFLPEMVTYEINGPVQKASSWVKASPQVLSAVENE